jgi:hypothetical protein
METQTKPAEPQPPPALTVVCVAGLIWWAYLIGGNLAVRFFDVSESMFPVRLPSAGGGGLFHLIFLGAMLNMRQWGVLGYIAVAAWYHIRYYLNGEWSWPWVVVSLSVIVVGLVYFRRMR